VPLIAPFDPWQSRICTCLPKLTLNPYTGCDHNCVYCYAQTYIPRFHTVRPKRDLLKRLEREAPKLNGEIISLSNSSDPYPRVERDVGLTREVLRTLASNCCRIQIITKSTLVARDADVLRGAPATIALTVTTDDDDISRILEPNVPEPSERLKTIETLVKQEIPVIVRMDPIIPCVNNDCEALIEKIASNRDWKRFSQAFPNVAQKLAPLYWRQGERMGGCVMLPRDLRLKILSNVRKVALRCGLQFGVCREGLSELNTAPCDGSWLLPRIAR
jgi:DNA repair photolyase